MDDQGDGLEEGEIPCGLATAAKSNPNNGFSLEIDAIERHQYAAAPAEDDDWEQVVGKRMKKKKKKEKYEQNTKPNAATGHTAVSASLLNRLYGDNPRASVEVKEANAIRLADVQNLVLWVLGEACCPRWVFLKGKPLVKQVVLVVAHGLSQDLFNEHKDLMPSLGRFGTPAVVVGLNTTVRPGQTVSALLHIPARKQKKRKAAGAHCSPPFPPSHYVVTLKQMEEHRYPLPQLTEQGTLRCPDGFVVTQPTGGGTPPSEPELVALDCEMCITANGFEVTRVTLVGREGGVLLDELVVPDTPITDYNTRFSGITAAMLADCTNRLPDIQERFLSIVRAETLLVGHALENDLLALKVVHANCLDTALLYPHPKGPPYKSALKVLAQKFLKRSIQQGSHDSAVDARTALDLTLLKIKHGPTYGTEDGRDVEKLADVLAEQQVRSCLVDHPAALQRYATGSCSAVPATDDADAAQRAAKAVAANAAGPSGGDTDGPTPLYRFVWTQFSGLNSLHVQRAARLRARLLPQSLALQEGGTVPPAAEGPPTGASERSGGDPSCSTGAAPAGTTKGKRSHSGDCEATAAAAMGSPTRKKARKGADGAAGTSNRGGEDAKRDGSGEDPGDSPSSPAPPPPPQEGDCGAGEPPDDDGELCDRLRALDAHVGSVCNALPVNSLMLVVTGQGDTAHIRLLQEMKYKRQSGVDDLPPWNLAEEENMNAVATSAIQGLCFCSVKQ